MDLPDSRFQKFDPHVDNHIELANFLYNFIKDEHDNGDYPPEGIPTPDLAEDTYVKISDEDALGLGDDCWSWKYYRYKLLPEALRFMEQYEFSVKKVKKRLESGGNPAHHWSPQEDSEKAKERMAKRLKRRQEEKDKIYHDRNLAVLLALQELQNAGFEVGWREDPNEDDNWAVAFVLLQKGDESSQAAWHVPKEMIERLDWIEEKDLSYDGHSKDRKLMRVAQFIGYDHMNPTEFPLDSDE